MNETKRSRASIFLIEFLIALLVFSLSCVVALRIFARADALSDGARRTDCAAAVAFSASEQLKSLLTNGDAPETLELVYDQNCKYGGDSPAFVAVAELSFAGGLAQGEIKVYEYSDDARETPLVEAPFALFLGQEGGL